MRAVILSLAFGTLSALSACGTDNGPQVDAAPPGQAAADAAPTPETIAWADQLVTDALAAEASARAAGKDDNAVADAVQLVLMQNIDMRIDAHKTSGKAQLVAGLGLAMNSPRNTPLTKALFQQIETMVAGEAPGNGNCIGCKGKR